MDPQNANANPRAKIVDIISKKSGLDEVFSKDMEIGIYNWCIMECGTKRIARNWSNPKFYKLYIEKARSIISNIDSKSYIKNTNLIERVKDKEFFPHDLAFMKPENVHPDMWSKTVDTLLKKYENAYENKAVAMTDMFKCGRCKKRECTFFEMQSRSADEPMTVFIRCVNCGNSWRQ